MLKLLKAASIAAAITLTMEVLLPHVSAAVPEDISPGERIVIANANGQWSTCSLGPYVRFTSDGSTPRYAALTAGHCGSEGDAVYRLTSDDRREHIGALFAPVNDRNAGGARLDWSLIPLDPSYVNSSIDSTYPPRGIMLLEELAQAHRRGEPVNLCAAGTTTGVRCGPLVDVNPHGYIGARFPSDHGDSGGPVWAQTAEGAKVVGLLRGNLTRDESVSVIVPIQLPLRAYDAKLLITE